MRLIKHDSIRLSSDLSGCGVRAVIYTLAVSPRLKRPDDLRARYRAEAATQTFRTQQLRSSLGIPARLVLGAPRCAPSPSERSSDPASIPLQTIGKSCRPPALKARRINWASREKRRCDNSQANFPRVSSPGSATTAGSSGAIQSSNPHSGRFSGTAQACPCTGEQPGIFVRHNVQQSG